MSPRASSRALAPGLDRAPAVQEYAEVLRRRRGVAAAVAALVFGGLAAYAFLSTPIYRAVALLNIERVNEVVSPKSGYPPADEEYLPTQARLIVSDTALNQVYAELRLGEIEEFSGGVPALRAAVSVLPVPRTRLCYVNAESENPALAAVIANALTRNFARWNLENQLFMPKEVLNALRTRAKGPRAQEIYESLPAVVDNELLRRIKGQILDREVALAELRAKYTDDHPAVLAVKAQVGLLQEARARELDTVVRSLTTALSGQLRPNNVRVVDPARPPGAPARPRKGLALLLGLVGGLGLGLLAALALESLDQTVRTHADLERKLGVPFLGQIPFARRKEDERVYAALIAPEGSIAGDAFRDLRTMLAIANQRKADPAVLITSATQQEGKSYVATNLAVALSQLGLRVLVIDGDLRRPTQDRNLGSAAKLGLSEFLSGAVPDVERLLQPTQIPNLDVIVAGKRRPNASELLNARRLEQLLGWARGRYDRVLVDCPPVFPAGDVLLWGRHVGLSILVSRCGRTRVPMIRLACERLRAGGVDVVGGVINGARLGALPYAYERES